MFFGYVKSDKICYLKDSKATPSANQDRISGPKTCPCFKEGMDYFLYDISTIRASNAEECQTSCQNVDACIVWTFLKSTKQCFIKWKQNKASEYKNPEDIVSGPKFCQGILKLKVCIKRKQI